jgi:predicted RNase H-like nuclease
MTWVAGADGFKRGWRVALCNTGSDDWLVRDVATFGHLLGLRENPIVICVDMPIGLPEHTPPGGRACEIAARRILGPRRSSVFSAVGRLALSCESRAEAHATSVAAGGIGIGAQAWGLATKLREIDNGMSAERQAVVFEVHPEVCFWALNGGEPMAHSKHTPDGQSARLKVLVQNGLPAPFLTDTLAQLRFGRDDFLDACAAAWTARRIFRGIGKRLPKTLVRDSRGLDMAMWY